MRLMVTGGAGFIGSNFIRLRLERHPWDHVVNFDLLTYAGDRTSLHDIERSAGERYRLVRGDISDLNAVDAAIAEYSPEAIVNFAAESHNSRAVVDPLAFVRTNVQGTAILLEIARKRGVNRFHHISTCEVYGDLALDAAESFSEAAPYRPQTPYNASKAAADHLVRAYGHTYGLNVTITNCSNNYGPYQHPEKVIPLFITSALRGRQLPLYRHSEHRREWLYVDDHCEAIDRVLSSGRAGETYNVGSGDERSVEEIADVVLAAVGAPDSLKTYVPDRPQHDRRYLLDHSKITSELGWVPSTSFDAGLKRTVDWYRAHPDWWRAKVARATVDEFAWSRTAK